MRPSEREFAEFLERVERPVHRALLAAFGAVDGRVAAQSAFEWAWEHWDRVITMTNPAAYLYRVGCTAAARERPRELPVGANLESSVSGAIEVHPELLRGLDQLAPQQRVAVVLVHGYGYTLREAAVVLGINPSTVRAHAQRALNRLRRTLEETDVA